MQINLTDVLSCEEKVVKRTVETELTSFDISLGSFPLTEKQPLELRIANMGDNKLEISGTASYETQIPCDRCLEEVKTSIELDFSKEVDMNLSAEGRIEDLDETDFIIGYSLDVDKLIYSEILVNWPMKTLCKEDCKGLCQKCGKDLNEGPCDCPTGEINPAFAKLLQMFDDDEEKNK